MTIPMTLTRFPSWATEDGSIVLYNADCLDVLPLLEAGSVDAVVTDPQYGISLPGSDFQRVNGKGKRRFDFFDGDHDHSAVLGVVEQALRQSMRVVVAGASFYVFCGHRQFGDICELCESFGYKTRFIVWSKTCPAPAPPGSGWPAGAELCVYAFAEGRTWNPRPGDAPFSNVLRYDSYRHGQPGKVDHPTQKPLGLIQELVEYSTKPGHLVGDWFSGSGTTAVACINSQRRFIGCEKDRAHFATACQRLSEAVKRTALFDPPPRIVQRSLLEDVT